jgi:hypothetical protein
MVEPIVSQDAFHDNTLSKGDTPSLWAIWWNALWLLRPAFSHLLTFMWFATTVVGFSVRIDQFGVTSIVRALKLRPCCYSSLIKTFHSNAVQLDQLTALWAQVVLRLFPAPLRINGRIVLVGDGIKIAKRGKQMPGVKSLHQQSENKPEWIMGHSLQAVSILVHAAACVLAVPLGIRIHEGTVYSNRDKRTLLDKMLSLIGIVSGDAAFYFVGDAYYATGKMINGLLAKGNHLITRMKSTAVAYEPHIQEGPKKRGRPKLYGEKITLVSLLKDLQGMQQAISPVYGP